VRQSSAHALAQRGWTGMKFAGKLAIRALIEDMSADRVTLLGW
jgi:hypothetical protein